MKFLEKHGLFKLVGIILIISVLLTWLTPTASFTDGELVASEYSRIGLFDISTYGLLGFNYFPFIFIFLFVVAGFYRFLETTDAFKVLVDKIAKKFENKLFVFTMVSMVVYGLLASVVVDYTVLFVLIPLTIAIMAKLNATKISTFVSTFGGILLGVLSSTLNGNVSTVLSSTFTFTNFNPEYIAAGVVFVIGSILLGYLTALELKVNGKNEDKRVVDLLADEKVEEEVVETKTKKSAKKSKEVVKVSKKANIVPISIIFVITVVISLLGYIKWENIGVTLFTDLHTYITEATLFDVTVFKFILGSSSSAFGTWSLFNICGIIAVATLIISIVYNIKIDQVVDSYIDGFKKYGKTVLLVFFIYIVLSTQYFFPTVGTITDWVVKTFGDNFGTWMFTSAFTSIFTVEFQYTILNTSGLLLSLGTETPEIVALATQFGYGLISFVAPTSVMLAAGLHMLGINIKEYFKFIWKFLVAMLIVVVIVLAILTLM